MICKELKVLQLKLIGHMARVPFNVEFFYISLKEAYLAVPGCKLSAAIKDYPSGAPYLGMRQTSSVYIR